MQTRALALVIAGSLVLGSTVAVVSSDDLSDLLPTQIGDEPMLPVPDDIMDVAAPIVPLDGVDGEIAMAGNYDLAGFLAAAEQEALTEADGEAFLRWAEEEMLVVAALRFEGMPADQVLESAAAADPDLAANTSVALLDGRDILIRAPTAADHWAWAFLYLYDEVLFMVISADPQLQMREALAALPPPVDQTLPSGRIERPADGYAITFPDGWLVHEFTRELYIDVNGFPPEPDEVPYLFAQRVADRSEVECQLNNFSDFALDWPVATVAEATEFFGDAAEDDVRFFETMAGRVGHVRDGTLETYVYHQANRWVYLQCSGYEASEDIATIAQSFEFAPPR